MQGTFWDERERVVPVEQITVEDSRSMCDHKKKYTCVHRNCESGLAIICHGDGMGR